MMMMMTAWFVMMPATGCVAEVSPATRPAGDVSVEQWLREAHSRRALALRELDQLEGRVDDATRQIMRALDDLMAGEIAGRFEPHYEKVEARIRKAGLLDDVSAAKIIWEQIRAGVGVTGGLEELCRNYIEGAVREIEPLQEQLARQIGATFGKHLGANLTTAQEGIRSGFQEILFRHFPAWQGVNLAPPPLPPDRMPEGLRGETDQPLGIPALVGLLALVTGRIIRRLVPRLVARMVGRVLTRLIPVVGALLVAWDVWDAATARSRLDTALRTEFMKEYRESFHADALWQAPVDADDERTFREKTRDDLHSLLTQWTIHCRQEARNTLNAAHVLHLSETVPAYLRDQERRGRHTGEVVQDLVLVWDTFGPLSARKPIEDLLNLLIHADPATLRPLVERLGDGLLELYRAEGSVVLQAADVMGPDAFVKAVGADLSWSDLVDAFRLLPNDASRDARQGLFLLIGAGFEGTGVPVSSLESVGRNEPLFRQLASILNTDRNKLLELLTVARRREAVEDGLRRDRDATAVFVRAWEVIAWRRYHAGPRRDALYAVAEIVRERDGKDAVYDLADDLAAVRALVDAVEADRKATWWGAFGPQFQVGYPPHVARRSMGGLRMMTPSEATGSAGVLTSG